MTELQEKQLAFLEETINHFNINNRGYNINISACSYSAGCAIGRNLDIELCKLLDNHECGDSGIENNEIFELIPTNLQELTQKFLIEIQVLHDSKSSWDENGLSEIGKMNVQSIKKQFKLN